MNSTKLEVLGHAITLKCPYVTKFADKKNHYVSFDCIGKQLLINLKAYIRVIPQGTVDNNLGPDRLAGPKALDPNYCRQPTL